MFNEQDIFLSIIGKNLLCKTLEVLRLAKRYFLQYVYYSTWSIGVEILDGVLECIAQLRKEVDGELPEPVQTASDALISALYNLSRLSCMRQQMGQFSLATISLLMDFKASSYLNFNCRLWMLRLGNTRLCTIEQRLLGTYPCPVIKDIVSLQSNHSTSMKGPWNMHRLVFLFIFAPLVLSIVSGFNIFLMRLA